MSRIMEIDDERKEHQLVLDTIKDVEDTRKCWRLVNGVLFEKTKADLVPELTTSVQNMQNVINQLSDALQIKKQESFKLEQQYESIMKQAQQKKKEDVKQGEVKAGGVLV